MADNDSFESSTGTYDTSVDYKYAQLVVPNHELDVTSTTAATSSTVDSSGSSFLRLGSFPAGTTTDTDLPGFSKSYTLAKLIGDTSSVSDYDTAEDDAPGGSHILRESPFEGDKAVGFADDTRYRKDASDSKLFVNTDSTATYQTNSITNRKAETKRLLTKGCWWDHAGGNRVSTTAGDKIEVIQGNYKMIVLGRREPNDTNAEKGKITDISGGKEFSKTYEYSSTTDSDGNAIWSTYEESSEAFATKVTSGVEVSYFEGTRKETIVGEDPDAINIKKPSSYLKSTNKDRDPDVISRTWAKSTETYVGSANKPVPHVFSLAYTKFREEVQISTTSVTTRVALANFTQVNVGGTFVDGKVAVTALLTTNVAPILVKIDAAGQAYDMKYGFIYARVIPNEQKINALGTYLAAKKTAIAASADRLCANMSTLAASAYDVFMDDMRLLGQQMALTGTAMSMSMGGTFYM